MVRRELNRDADRHQFMFPLSEIDPEKYAHKEQKSDPVEIVGHIRDFISSLPPYKATFKLSELIEGTNISSASIVEPMVWLADSWKIPQFYGLSDSKGTRFVNPGYEHIQRYSDAAAKCECGAVVQKLPGGGGHGAYLDDRGHADDCLPEYRADVLSRAYRNRRLILQRQALLGKPCHESLERCFSDHKDVSHLSSRLGISGELGELKDRGIEKRSNTMAGLVSQGYETTEVAQVYGLSPSSVRTRISRDTSHTITELRNNA